ncbi:Major Facilitator Superfamily protein [Microbulbifer thermotolerans]|uniref:MFS transporter n=1 Tax=Microbulbifer thermotolerans TaxID=252514 RepID=UPI0008EDCCE5|nr:MFS transporter [Microbulbifer thermotolerans]SFC10289.1 Major Facilitator Superfamily protein [Microbulbifer thermotolerans]
MAEASAPQPGPQQPVFNLRLALGLLGILLAAMTAGLNSRVPGLALADIRGQLGLSYDQGTWLSTLYAAGELIAMPFASWFGITFSLRRFHLSMLLSMMALAVVMPFVGNFYLLAGLRLLQGLFAGALIPLLMGAALRFLPLSIRLHGLALYAMTATLSPNVAVWLAAQLAEDPVSLNWLYWQVIPLGLLAAALVYYGIPASPPALPRLKQGNWLGMALGVPGLGLLAIGIGQGVRLEWLHSPLICLLLGLGGVLTLLFLISEWRHPAPFIRLQMLSRRNLGLGFTVFFFLLVAMSAGVSVPVSVLAQLQGFRLEQMTALGLIIGLPQLFMGSVVALLLYRRWMDARYLFALGLGLMALGCFLASRITSEWMVDQFFWSQVLQAIGQPIAVVCLLFLGTSVVQPMEGPFVAGIVNTIRALGTLLGGAFVGQLTADRSRFHSDMLLNHAGMWLSHNPAPPAIDNLAQVISTQAAVLASADIFLVFMTLLLVLIPPVLCLQYVPAPRIPAPPAAQAG